jgi:hypothetical protein
MTASKSTTTTAISADPHAGLAQEDIVGAVFGPGGDQGTRLTVSDVQYIRFAIRKALRYSEPGGATVVDLKALLERLSTLPEIITSRT